MSEIKERSLTLKRLLSAPFNALTMRLSRRRASRSASIASLCSNTGRPHHASRRRIRSSHSASTGPNASNHPRDLRPTCVEAAWSNGGVGFRVLPSVRGQDRAANGTGPVATTHKRISDSGRFPCTECWWPRYGSDGDEQTRGQERRRWVEGSWRMLMLKPPPSGQAVLPGSVGPVSRMREFCQELFRKRRG